MNTTDTPRASMTATSPDYCPTMCRWCPDCTATMAHLDWLDECRRLASDAGAREAIWPPLDDLADQAADAAAEAAIAVMEARGGAQ